MIDFIKSNPSLMLDGVLVIILLIYAVKGYLDGLLSSVINLVGNIGSLVVAFYVSDKYSPVFFDSVLRESMIRRSYNYLVNTRQQIDVKTALDGVIGKAPQFLVENVLQKAQSAIDTALMPTMESATLLVDDFIRPVIVPCITTVMFVLVFVAVKFICRLLSSILKKMNDVPILGTANQMTGFVIGIVIGCINIILLSFLLSIIILATNDSLSYVNSAVVSGSKILALAGLINPFLP